MGTSLYLITNSKLTGKETNEDWVRIVNKLQQLQMKTTSYFNSKHELIKEEGDWNYYIYEEDAIFNVSFDSPFHIIPNLYSKIGVISTIYKYRLLYDNYNLDWFASFRNDLYNIVKIMGGSEVIYLADNDCDKLSNYLINMAWENVSYEKIKSKMLQEFGSPRTQYSELNFDTLTYEKIDEFFLDDFFDLKMKDLKANL